MDAIETAGLHKIIGYLDDTVALDVIKRGYAIIGRFADVPRFKAGFVMNDRGEFDTFDSPGNLASREVITESHHR